jgi:hypothetical protein
MLRQSSDVRCWGVNRPKSAAPEGRLLTHQRHAECFISVARHLITEVLAFADSAVYVYRKIVRPSVAA